MSGSRLSSRVLARGSVVLIACALVVTATALSACGSSSGTGYGMKPSGSAPVVAVSGKTAMAGTSATDTGTTDPSVQTCGVCGGKGMPKTIVGIAAVKNGIQVISIAIQGGYYVPNHITAKSGMPIQVVFSGKAKGCIAKPMFKSLGKSGNLTSTGTATLDLGTLKPGAYAFSCAMGMGDGLVTVQ
jgi:hypothetical protein